MPSLGEPESPLEGKATGRHSPVPANGKQPPVPADDVADSIIDDAVAPPTPSLLPVEALAAVEATETAAVEVLDTADVTTLSTINNTNSSLLSNSNARLIDPWNVGNVGIMDNGKDMNTPNDLLLDPWAVATTATSSAASEAPASGTTTTTTAKSTPTETKTASTNTVPLQLPRATIVVHPIAKHASGPDLPIVMSAPPVQSLSSLARGASSVSQQQQQHHDDTRIRMLEQELQQALDHVQSLQQLQQQNQQQSDVTSIANGSIHDNDSNKYVEQQQQQQQQQHNGDMSKLLLEELQSNLQHQMNLKAEAENRSRLAEQAMTALQIKYDRVTEEMQQYRDFQQLLEEQMDAKAAAEYQLRQSMDRARDMNDAITTLQQDVQEYQQKLQQAQQHVEEQQLELDSVRQQRDEQARKEMALTSRLNAAKKKEAEQANRAEELEHECKALQLELEETKQEYQENKSAKEQIQQELDQLHRTTTEHIRQLERSLTDERLLNEDRKRKMKAFVENKTEELRQAKADHESMQIELTQTSRSLADMNSRWTQLHAQYVQSQTRNRELQRDLSRIKKDSENLHKVGDSLEMKLSRSATETEEHKNKRLAAKHELMTVLRTLEVERHMSNKMRESLKLTFTPKALSQQQLLQESLHDFEVELEKLSRRLGKPLPTMSTPPHIMSDNSDPSDVNHDGVTVPDDSAQDGSTNSNTNYRTAEADVQRLIAKLERETQGVSQSILALQNSIERLHTLLNNVGERNCYTVLSELLTTGGSTAVASPNHPLIHGRNANSRQHHDDNDDDEGVNNDPDMYNMRNNASWTGQPAGVVSVRSSPGQAAAAVVTAAAVMARPTSTSTSSRHRYGQVPTTSSTAFR